MKKGVILDVDGTLWDAVGVITESWNEYRRRYIPEIPAPFLEDQVRGMLGKTMTEIRDLRLGALPMSRRQEAMDGVMKLEVEYMYEHGGKVYPGVTDTLRRLSAEGIHLYIVSNCQKGYIEDFIHATGTRDIIEDHVCFGDTGRSKDFSIRLCMERNELDEAVYVGDTQGDLNACRAAEVPFIYAAYGFGDLDAEAEKVPQIMSFAELPDVVRKMWR